jgi:hypothetical protein
MSMARDLGEHRPHLCERGPLLDFVRAASSAQAVAHERQLAAFAAKGKTVSVAHMHLHHVINCLVRPSGEGFDAQAGNPCQGEGNGAVRDFSGPPEKKAMLEQALALAKVGVQIGEPAPVRTTAQAVRQLLHGTETAAAPYGARGK